MSKVTEPGIDMTLRSSAGQAVVLPQSEHVRPIADCEQLRSRAKIIPRSTWEQFRPVIEALYIDDELKLGDVAQIMAQKHGFLASPSMYKKRLRVWQARKYYTQEQKRCIMGVLVSVTKSKGSKAPSSWTINRKPLKVNRLLPRVHNSGRAVSLMPPANPSKKRLVEQHAHQSQTRSKMFCLTPAKSIPFPLGPGHADGIGKFHRAVQQYYTWYTSQAHAGNPYGVPDELIHVINLLIDARAALQTQLQSAFGRLDRFCSRLWPLMVSQPFHLLGELVGEFVQEKWQSHRALRLSLLHYLKLMAFQLLGQQHPIFIIITTLSVNDNSQGYASTFYNMLLDTVSSVLGRNCEDYLQIHLSTVCSLIEIGNLTTAEALCLQITRETTARFPCSHLLSRRARGLMASLRYWQRDLSGAELVLLEENQVAIENCGAANGDGQGIFTCGALAIIYLLQERYDESMAFARLASLGGLRCGDREWEPVFVSDLEDMKGALLQQHQHQQRLVRTATDVARIQEEHTHVWKKVEAWTVRS